MTLTAADTQPATTPFDLDNDALYRAWRDRKLAGYPTSLGDLVVEIADPRTISDAEYAALMTRVGKANMAVYVTREGDNPDKAIPHAIAARLGISRLNHNWLADDDGLTSLTVRDEGTRNHYIPYSNRAINWHTDGYYNTLDRQIHSLNLHCVRPAAEGGLNRLMDHEMAYIQLRDENPDYIRALMADDAMTLPARIDEGGKVARPEEPGPVFSVDPLTGDLHMRHTIRKENVIWKQDTASRAAVNRLEAMLEEESPYIYQGLLESGMGLISTNVLHDRSGFEDDAERPRLLYRARYFDRIPGSGVREVYSELFD